MSRKPSVFLMHNVVVPYRLPVFEVISHETDLDVYFCRGKEAGRKWTNSFEGYSFRYHILKHWQIGPAVFNPTLLWNLIRRPYDLYLVGDFPEVAFSTFVTIAVAKLWRRPVVLWSETIDHDVNYFQHIAVSSKPMHRALRSLLNSVITAYRRALLQLPDQYVAFGEMAKRFLLSEDVPESRIHSGIQVMPRELLAKPDTSKADSPYADKKLFLYLGYFNALKGISGLIETFMQLHDPDARLAIVGTGPEEEKLKALAESDSRIEFPGYVEAVQRANLFEWADAMVLPTLADCWAFVINESLYYGTPIITTDVAGASELVTSEKEGVVIPHRDEEALLKALNKVLSEKTGAKRPSKNSSPRKDITDSHVGASPILKALAAASGDAQ